MGDFHGVPRSLNPWHRSGSTDSLFFDRQPTPFGRHSHMDDDDYYNYEYEPRASADSSFNSTTATSTAVNPNSVSTSSGELVDLPSKPEIVKALECPVCQDSCLPPIWNCGSGHIVCNSCRPRLTRCALCKAYFTSSRNYGLEAIALVSKFQCQFKAEGCQEVVEGSKFSEHITSCSFKHFHILPLPTYSEERERRRQRPRTLISPQPGLSSFDDEDDDVENIPIPWEQTLANHLNRQYNGLIRSTANVVPLPSTPSPPDGGSESWDARSYTPTSPGRSYTPTSPMGSPAPSSHYETTRWVRACNGDVPENAVVGGVTRTGEQIYVIRAYHGRTAVAGQLVASERAAFVVFGGLIRRKWYYDVLVAVPGSVTWKWDMENRQGMLFASGGSHYAVARAYYDGRFICGTVPPGEDRCFFKVGRNRGESSDTFQLLITNY